MKQGNRNIASDLIESTVKVIARDGFDKASTRKIAGECGIADAYIYFHFKDKDDLFSKAFQKEDTALAGEVRKYLPILNQEGLTNGERLCFLFGSIWRFLTSYPANCRFFVQYYYSPYYAKYSAQEHSAIWTPVLEQMKKLFRPEADVRALLRPVLNTMLGQAISAASDTSTDKESIGKNNCALVLGMLSAGLADE